MEYRQSGNDCTAYGYEKQTTGSNDEFSERIEAMIADGISIEPQPVFEIRKDIYIRYEKEREESPDKLDFNFYLARGGIKSLWKSMTGSTEGWR